MEILNIGPLELIIILALMFILLGPKEMVLTAHRIGAWVRNFLRSPMWREIWGISQDIRELPKKIVSESGLEETMEELKQTTQEATDEINKEHKEVAEARGFQKRSICGSSQTRCPHHHRSARRERISRTRSRQS
jgi:Sec-independent protein translocase protein TatA